MEEELATHILPPAAKPIFRGAPVGVLEMGAGAPVTWDAAESGCRRDPTAPRRWECCGGGDGVTYKALTPAVGLILRL